MYPTCTVPTRLALSYRANLYWPYGYRTVLTNRYLYRTNLYWPYGYRTVLTNRYLYRTNLYWPYGYRTVLTNRYLYRTNLYWPYGYRTVLTNRYLYRTNWYCGPHTRYRSSLAIERHRRDAVGDTDGLTVQKDIGEQSNNLI